MKIVLLEDDYALHSAVKKVLEFDGHEVYSYYDGELLFKALSHFVDLYILDINVPNIDGLEILEKIKFINPNAKVMMISANSDLISIKSAYQNGCDDYIKKPFYIEELQIKIAQLERKQNDGLKLSETITYHPNEQLFYDAYQRIELSKNEHLLLELLVTNIDTIVHKEQIFTLLETQVERFSDNALRSLIKRIRHKMGGLHLETVFNEGYMLHSQH